MCTTKNPACGNEPFLPAGKNLSVDVIRHLPLATLKPYARNARRHGDKQIDLIARSIREFGFVNPVLIDRDNAIVAGHGRFEAARRLGLATVPTVLLEHLTDAQVRAYRIADNRIAELSDWDADLLRLEIVDLSELEFKGDLDFDLSLTGFDTPGLDIILEGKAEGKEDREGGIARRGNARHHLPGRSLDPRRALAPLRRCASRGELHPAHGRRTRANGVHRPALQCPNQRPRPGRSQRASRIRDGRRRDVGGGVPRFPRDQPAALQVRSHGRWHRLRLHGLET